MNMGSAIFNQLLERKLFYFEAISSFINMLLFIVFYSFLFNITYYLLEQYYLLMYFDLSFSAREASWGCYMETETRLGFLLIR